MAILGSKSSTREKPDPVWYVVERNDGGTSAWGRSDRQAAIDDFAAWVRDSAGTPDAFNPHRRGHRLLVTGPDRVLLADSDTDPLVVGDAALHAVLTPDEYRTYVLGPRAAALLES